MPGAFNPFTRSFDQKPDPDVLRERDRRRLEWLEQAQANQAVLGDPLPQYSALGQKAAARPRERSEDRPRGPARVPVAKYG